MFGTTFTAWTLFTDFAIISGLLLIGQLMRAKIKIIQQLFIPPSLLAGFLGLIFGPNGLGWLPISSAMVAYAGILIALVFGGLGLGMGKIAFSEIKHRIGGLWVYSQNGILMQWGIAALLGPCLLNLIWPDLSRGFGAILAIGYYGGHGTAAAVGASFSNLGWDEATSLGMTVATVGIIASIVGGLILIKWATRKKYTQFITDFKNLPQELRTGLLPEDKRESLGTATTSPISIESFTLHLSIIFLIAFGGYMFSMWIKGMNPKLELPVFSCAFLSGLIFQQLLSAMKAKRYVCPVTVSRLGSTFTDYLVAFGVAAIKLDVVVKYAAPLLIIVALGMLVVAFTSLYLGHKMLKTYWAEKSIFCWGWWTGTMAMGIALLRIVDPKFQSKSLDDITMSYLPIAPLEILLITFAPIIFMSGWNLWLSLACLGATATCLFVSHRIGWWRDPKEKR